MSLAANKILDAWTEENFMKRLCVENWRTKEKLSSTRVLTAVKSCDHPRLEEEEEGTYTSGHTPLLKEVRAWTQIRTRRRTLFVQPRPNCYALWHPQWAGPRHINHQSRQSLTDTVIGHPDPSNPPQLRLPQMTLGYVNLTAEAK